MRDGHTIERWDPRLQCVETTSPMLPYAKVPAWRHRLVFRSAGSTGWSASCADREGESPGAPHR
jgi:hypothetical protein